MRGVFKGCLCRLILTWVVMVARDIKSGDDREVNKRIVQKYTENTAH